MPTRMNNSTATQDKRKQVLVSYAGMQEDIDASDYTDIDQDYEPWQGAKSSKPNRKTSSMEETSDFEFLELPPEIRNAIYELRLTGPKGLLSSTKIIKHRVLTRRVAAVKAYKICDTQADKDYFHLIADGVALSPSLLIVNRQVHAEAINHLYQQTLHFTDSKALYAFAISIGSLNLQRLRQIHAYSWGTWASDHSTLTALGGITSLRELRIMDSIMPNNTDLYADITYRRHARKMWRDGYFFFFAAQAKAPGWKLAGLERLSMSAGNFDPQADSKSEESKERLDRNIELFLEELIGLIESD